MSNKQCKPTVKNDTDLFFMLHFKMKYSAFYVQELEMTETTLSFL